MKVALPSAVERTCVTVPWIAVLDASSPVHSATAQSVGWSAGGTVSGPTAGSR